MLTHISFPSVGHLVIDSLAKRLNIHLSSQKTVVAGSATVPISGVNTNIVLAKTSERFLFTFTGAS
jgi:hypothetical protein